MVAFLGQQPVVLLALLQRMNQVIVMYLVCEFGWSDSRGDVSYCREQDGEVVSRCWPSIRWKVLCCPVARDRARGPENP